MLSLITYLLTLGAAATALNRPFCPTNKVLPPPPGSDIALCPTVCIVGCYYAPETNDGAQQPVLHDLLPMLSSVAYLLSLGAVATAIVCPLVIVEPPPGSDIGLCPTICRDGCFYAPETNDLCSNGPSSFDRTIEVFEVLSSQFCTIYSEENCYGEVAQLQGPNSVNFNATSVKSVKCVA
ncbi:hypothetical protein NM688_g1068 [Phlebia brevispora]|uniref:Uncharacterized protein n=1 Tax=Phlebia brevispora TaxID=194682 RepID=A0ACC1TCD0_9APHY|nr:hypothetical protein NM688_g1068 [Phlebia brevispora]